MILSFYFVLDGSTGVKCETSTLTKISLLISFCCLNIFTKRFEFSVCENIVSACASSCLTRYLTNKGSGDAMALTIGPSGIYDLRILICQIVDFSRDNKLIFACFPII